MEIGETLRETRMRRRIDMTEVEFLDQAGLSALVTAHRAAQRQDEPLRVVVDHNRPVVRPLAASIVTVLRFSAS